MSQTDTNLKFISFRWTKHNESKTLYMGEMDAFQLLKVQLYQYVQRPLKGYFILFKDLKKCVDNIHSDWKMWMFGFTLFCSQRLM